MNKDERANVEEVSDPSIANQDFPLKKVASASADEPNSTKQRAFDISRNDINLEVTHLLKHGSEEFSCR